MNDTIKNVEVVDPTLPIITDAPGIVTEGDETIIHVAEEIADAPVED